MQIKSWYEEMREYREDEEMLAQKRQEALAYEARWRADNERLHHEEDIMRMYAIWLMEKELKALGDYIIKKFPNKEDKWIIADAVYHKYGCYYLLKNQPAEAIKWLLKAIKDGIPYPYNAWKDLAAAYVEAGQYKKADLWIKRYVEYYSKEGLISYSNWADFAKYYLERQCYEQALTLFLEGMKGEAPYHFDKPFLARAYFGVGEYEKGFQLYEEYLERSSKNEGDHAEIALAYYDYTRDLEHAEAHYLKSVEAAADRDDANHWNQQIYKNLSIIFTNEGAWDKCFHYLKLHYQNKFEGAEADMFSQIIDNMPRIEDDDMGREMYEAIKDFESSPLRPGGVRHTEGLVSEAPSAEVSAAFDKDKNLSDLFDWDEESISN